MHAEYELILKQYDQRELQTWIEDIQSRLGTCRELPDDMDRARAIAHQLNNILTSIRLRHELARFS